MRTTRVLSGSFLIIFGLRDAEYLFVGLGLLFLIQGVLDKGCSTSCVKSEIKDE